MIGKEIVNIKDYESIVGAETVQRVLDKAEPLRDLHITHINSTYYGGGVAEVLSSFVILMNSVGIKTGWRVLQGSPDYFGITKKIHNALQGSDINLSDRKKEIYESTVLENSIRNHLDHDIVIIHDPQPLPMINHYRKRGPWIWRCHIDLTDPNRELWNYLTRFVEKYDAVILSLEEYKKDLETPQLFFPPAINPFSIKNKDLSEQEIDDRMEHYKIPTDLPIITQISRFDKWKDPEGVIEAYKLIKKEVDCTLVLLGNVATDDPEGDKVYKSLLDECDDRLLILSHQDTALVNALQRRAAVVIQKSKREGFGLTVTEAMWKGKPVVGGNVGGIKYQIQDGENGFLVNSVEETAERVVQLLRDKDLCSEMGKKAKETVKSNFLLIHLLEHHLDLINSFESSFKIRNKHDVGQHQE
ncbi:MAG: glycosyltransferase [candidate division Zixibacteria bacterium]|nr:glycosyltransferase [candidate division Zixibacteria bacterium]